MRMTSFRRIALALPVAAALAGCQTTPPETAFPKLSYSHLQPIRLDVRRVEVVETYKSPATPPHVEHLFPVKPVDALRQWASDRLWAAGTSGVARFEILRASVVEVPLERTKGIKGWLTTDQTERYDGVIEVRLDILDSTGNTRGEVTSRTQRSRSVPEDVSLRGREEIWFRLTEAMMNDLNGSLETQIQAHLSNLLR